MALCCCIFPFYHSWIYCIVTKIVKPSFKCTSLCQRVDGAASLFLNNELTYIRWHDQNIITDTGVRCLVFVCEVRSVRSRLWTSIVWMRHWRAPPILMIRWRWRFWGRGRQGKCLRFLRGKVCQLRARGLQGTFSLHAIQRANSPRPCKQLKVAG